MIDSAAGSTDTGGRLFSRRGKSCGLRRGGYAMDQKKEFKQPPGPAVRLPHRERNRNIERVTRENSWVRRTERPGHRRRRLDIDPPRLRRRRWRAQKFCPDRIGSSLFPTSMVREVQTGLLPSGSRAVILIGFLQVMCEGREPDQSSSLHRIATARRLNPISGNPAAQ